MADDATPAVEENLLVDNDVNTEAGVTSDGAELGEAMLEESPSNPDSSTEEKTETTTDKSDTTTETKEAETDTEATADGKEEASDETSEESEEAVKQKNAQTRKEQLNREIRDAVSRKNRAEQEARIAELNAQKYRTQTVEELVENGLSPEEAQVEVRSQELEFQRFNADVSNLNTNLEIESAQVLAELPVFDPSSPEYNEPLAQRATELYRQVSGVQTDPQTGLITQASVLPYQFYKAFAETYDLAAQAGEQKGKLQGSRATEKMMAAVEPSSSAPVPEAEADEDDAFLKGFNKV